MLFFGQKDSPILNSSETVEIPCGKCGSKGTTSFHHFIKYVCITFGIPLFPSKSQIITLCTACDLSVSEEDFSLELKQAYHNVYLPKDVPFKYYLFCIVSALVILVRVSYAEAPKGGGALFFAVFNIFFIGGLTWVFWIVLKRLGKNPYLAFITLVPAFGMFIVIALIIYYYTQRNNDTEQGYQQGNFQPQIPKNTTTPAYVPTPNIPTATPQQQPSSTSTRLSEQQFSDLKDSKGNTLVLNPIEYDYLLETIMYNVVWYMRIHSLNPLAFNIDRLIKRYIAHEKMLNSCKNGALAENIDNLTAILEERNEKIRNNYDPEAIGILLQYIIFLHMDQGWTMGNFTENTEKLLRTFNIPKIKIQEYWFSRAKKMGLDFDKKVVKSIVDENNYTINNIFYSYSFYTETILLFQMWYLKSNSLNFKSFDLFVDKPEEAKLRLELMYWLWYDMSLEEFDEKMKNHVKITMMKFNRTFRTQMLYEVGALQKQNTWKGNFYTEATGKLLTMFGFPSLQAKTTWTDILNMTPNESVLEHIKQQNDNQVIAATISEERVRLEEQDKRNFLIITALFTKVWYVRENGLQTEDFNLFNHSEENTPVNNIETNLEKINIGELEFRTFGRLKTLCEYFESGFQQSVLQEVAKLHNSQAWNLPAFTEITNDLLDVMNINENHKERLWNNLISEINIPYDSLLNKKD